MKLIVPEKLKKGDLIGVVAPALKKFKMRKK